MVKSINIKKLHIKFVLRHHWERGEDLWRSKMEFKKKELGLFYRRSMCVGYEKHRPSYMFGINLIWVKMWMTVDYKVMHFKID
jgi:hypothetical protein